MAFDQIAQFKQPFLLADVGPAQILQALYARIVDFFGAEYLLYGNGVQNMPLIFIAKAQRLQTAVHVVQGKHLYRLVQGHCRSPLLG